MDKICPHKPGSGTPCLGKGEAFRFGHLILLVMTSRPRTDLGFNCRQQRQQLPRAAGEGRASPVLGSSRDLNLETTSATSTKARKDRKHPSSTAQGVCASNI